MRKLLPVLLAAALAACQGLPWTSGPQPAYLTVRPGSTLTLNRPLDIPGDKVSVFLQFGQLVHQSDIERYSPYCKFEIFTMSELTRRIDPDEFVIKRVSDEDEMVTRHGQMYAARVWPDSDGPTAIIYSTLFYLASEKQPDVFRLTCEHWTDPLDGEHLSLAQVVQALGSVLTLEVYTRD